MHVAQVRCVHPRACCTHVTGPALLLACRVALALFKVHSGGMLAEYDDAREQLHSVHSDDKRGASASNAQDWER